MGIANIDALTAEVAALNEALRIKLVAKANIPLYSSGREAQLAKLNQEIATIKYDIATVNAKITGVSTPPVSEPVPPAVANKPSTNKLTGQADGDSSFDKNEAAKISANQSDPVPEMVITGDRPKNGTKLSDAPGARLQNPLGDFSSYTYQLSLYMITPDAYNAFIISGRKDINAYPGTYIVAQSGGINATDNKRAFNYDYYIDDLKIKTATSAATQSESINTDMSFNIYEPYGFSFISNLKKAQDKLRSLPSKIQGYQKLQNASKQFFILGIRFQGYDSNGKVVTGSDIYRQDTFSKTSGGVFERFYDIIIKNIKFKIDGKATTYQIAAASIPSSVGYGVKFGRVSNGANIVASTVKEAIGGLIDDAGNPIPNANNKIGLLDRLNSILPANDRRLNDADGIVGGGGATPSTATGNIYKLKFVGGAETTIADATILSKADLDKTKWRFSEINNSTQSTVAKSLEQPTSMDRIMSFNNDISIQQAISMIIAHSSYIEDALKAIYKSTEEARAEGANGGPVVPKTSTPINWFNLSTEVLIREWNPLIGDFNYTITYIIQPYQTPAAISTYANNVAKYYGAHKKYNYWFTGNNSEILRYEQQLDNTYFNVALAPTGADASQGGNADIATIPNVLTGGNRQARIAEGNEAQNTYITNVKSPGDWATAKITILGDPDFLMGETVSTVGAVYDKFYGTNGYTINANGGQVFIEIGFKEAVDYENSTGLLAINEELMLWEYPASVRKELGSKISYRVITVTSLFSKGSFTQDLACNINTFPEATTAAATISTQRQGREEDGPTRIGKPGESLMAQTAASTAVTGSASAAVIASSSFAATDPRRIDINDTITNSVTGTQMTTPKGVANDDAATTETSKLASRYPQAKDAGREVTVTGGIGRGQGPDPGSTAIYGSANAELLASAKSAGRSLVDFLKLK